MDTNSRLDQQKLLDSLREDNKLLLSALEKTECGKKLLQQREEFSLLLDVGKQIVSELSLEKVFTLVADKARDIVHADLLVVPMLNENRDRYTYVAASGAHAEDVLGISFAINIGMCGWVLQNERSLLFGEDSPCWLDEKTAWEEGQQSALLVPLFGRKKIIGGLSALGKTGGGSFTQHDLDLLTVFANQVSIAIENARLFQNLENEVHERTQAEEALRGSEQFIWNILDTVDEGFIVVDRDFRLLIANKAYCREFAGTCDNIIGRHCYEITHKADRPCHQNRADCSVHHAFVTGEPCSAVHRHENEDGTILYFETKAFPVKDAAGSVTSVIQTVNNVTEKRLLEEERVKTQKLEAIGTLAGGIAHDFNNLLQGVFGYISLAKMNVNQTERAVTMLEKAEQALNLSVGLTTQLLTFSKGGKPVKKKLALRSVIESSAGFATSGSRVNCRITLDDDLWTVEADEIQIGQVIQNIVLNADQAMPLGGTIVINAKNVLASRDWMPHLSGEKKLVMISVQDSGIGIPGQYLQKIFDPYFTTKEKGSGLGLATSYSIVKNHGGAIDVASEVGRGTTFFIYLPAIESEEDISETPAESSAPCRGKILLMDDEQIVRDTAGEMIRSLGHDVDFAEHGEAALGKYQAARESGNPFDIVIMDLTIRGGMGGRETLERLCAIDPGVRAVVSSGYSDDAVLSDYQTYGFKARLSKPYRIAELRETLNALLGL